MNKAADGWLDKREVFARRARHREAASTQRSIFIFDETRLYGNIALVQCIIEFTEKEYWESNPIFLKIGVPPPTGSF